ncbi:hypothetical protein V6N13_140505 [Hibiscus sabdariffa]
MEKRNKLWHEGIGGIASRHNVREHVEDKSFPVPTNRSLKVESAANGSSSQTALADTRNRMRVLAPQNHQIKFCHGIGQWPCLLLSISIPNHKHPFNLTSSSTKAFAHPTLLLSLPQGPLSSARTQLDLLEQLSSTSSAADGYESDGRSGNVTIREQLAGLVGDRKDDFSIPLGKNLNKVGPKFLTISQKRNIRRQAYLNEVSRRNDSVFFATIGAFLLVPPLIILGIAILTGYVQLFP